MDVEQITKNIWRLKKGPGLSSNIYLIDFGEPILIDLGTSKNSKVLIKKLNSIGYKPEDIKIIIYTHFHYDHVGNPKDYPNAKLHASKDEIKSLKKAGNLAVLV